MAEQSSDEERLLPPSEKRLREAREQGQVPRSREIPTLLILGGATIFFTMGGANILDGVQSLMRTGLSLSRDQAFATGAMSNQLAHLSLDVLVLFSPLWLIALAGAIVGALVLGGWNFTIQPLQPNLGKLNPLTGIKRMFSWHSLGELGKASVAVIFLGAVGLTYVWHHLHELVALPNTDWRGALFLATGKVGTVLALLVIPMVAIAAIDAGLAWWRHYSQLRMSLEEIKREHREMEGNPEIKARIRQQQREMARKRMMQAVPTADVVITNPTHYAVALKYEEGKMRAPRLVAKGVDLTAARIRGLAAEHKVQLVEAPKLARALYTHAELDGDIPVTLYNAVAQVLAFVYQLRAGMPNAELGEVDVPPGMDPLENPLKSSLTVPTEKLSR